MYVYRGKRVTISCHLILSRHLILERIPLFKLISFIMLLGCCYASVLSNSLQLFLLHIFHYCVLVSCFVFSISANVSSNATCFQPGILFIHFGRLFLWQTRTILGALKIWISLLFFSWTYFFLGFEVFVWLQSSTFRHFASSLLISGLNRKRPV